MFIYKCLDEHANLMCIENEMVHDRPSDWIPELHDIPIGLVNAILYQTDYVIPAGKGNKKNKSTTHLIDTDSFVDSADEMSEADALALTRKSSQRKKKEYYKK